MESPPHSAFGFRAGYCIVAAAGLLLVGLGLGSHALLDPNEAKHALIARDMLNAGRWLEPVYNGIAYHDKPSLFYLLVGLAYRAFGVGEWAARAVPAAATVLTFLSTYVFATRRSPTAGVVAAGLLASSLFFVQVGRFTNLDALFTLLVSSALFVGLGTRRLNVRHRIPYPAFVLAALAVLVKGPVALVLLAPAFAVLAWTVGIDVPRLWRGSMLVVAVVGCWALPVYLLHPQYLVDFVWLHNLARYFTKIEKFHGQPPLFFVPVMLAGLLPWTSFVPQTVAQALRGSSVTDKALAIYAVSVVIFFSLSAGKLATYVLPAFPPLAVLVAWRVVDAEQDWHRWTAVALRITAAVFVLLAPCGAAAAAIADPRLLAVAATLIPISLGGLTSTAAAFAGRPLSGQLRTLCAGCLVTVLAVDLFAGAPLAAVTSDAQLALRAVADGRPDALVVYRVRPFSFLYYTGWPAVYKQPDAVTRSALAADGRRLVLTKASRLEALEAFAPGLRFRRIDDNGRHLLLEVVSEP